MAPAHPELHLVHPASSSPLALPNAVEFPGLPRGELATHVPLRTVSLAAGEFEHSHEDGLRRNPNLEGRVSARFVIGGDGAVSNVQNGGSDLPDSAVVSCVVQAFYGLSFPSPNNGIVRVSCPILFSPG